MTISSEAADRGNYFGSRTGPLHGQPPARDIPRRLRQGIEVMILNIDRADTRRVPGGRSGLERV